MTRPKLIFSLITAFIVGAFIGGDLGLRYAHSTQQKYTEELEDYYIDSRLLNLSLALMTFERAKEANSKHIISSEAVIIRGLFLSLVQLHETNNYKEKHSQIEERLRQAKDLMDANPAVFIKKSFVSVESITTRVNNPDEYDESSSKILTDQERTTLQAAFDYVDGIPEIRIEQGAAANP